MENNFGRHHTHTIFGELLCHLPYAIFSVSFGLLLLSFITYSPLRNADNMIMRAGSMMLFHSFHFMHIIFAATGTVITYLRFSQSMFKAFFIGIISPAIFCTLSDAILPYIGGRILGVSMNFHLCFISDFANIAPFLLIGVVNGFLMSNHHASRQVLYSLFSHFFHILLSSFASIFYLVSQGFTHWSAHIGVVFLFLIVSVIVPCSLSDVAVPMLFAQANKNDEKYKS